MQEGVLTLMLKKEIADIEEQIEELKAEARTMELQEYDSRLDNIRLELDYLDNIHTYLDYKQTQIK